MQVWLWPLRFQDSARIGFSLGTWRIPARSERVSQQGDDQSRRRRILTRCDRVRAENRLSRIAGGLESNRGEVSVPSVMKCAARVFAFSRERIQNGQNHRTITLTSTANRLLLRMGVLGNQHSWQVILFYSRYFAVRFVNWIMGLRRVLSDFGLRPIIIRRQVVIATELGTARRQKRKKKKRLRRLLFNEKTF